MMRMKRVGERRESSKVESGLTVPVAWRRTLLGRASLRTLLRCRGFYTDLVDTAPDLSEKARKVQ